MPDTVDVLLLYPGESLSRQICRVAEQDSQWRIETSFERSLPEIRRQLRRSSLALIDATEDPSQATDAFLQAVARLGRDAAAMYTDVMHEGLELFVRLHGSPFFLGPLHDEEWAKLFERLPARKTALPTRQTFERQRQLRPRVLE